MFFFFETIPFFVYIVPSLYTAAGGCRHTLIRILRLVFSIVRVE